jgi:MFS family permease
MSSAYKNYLLGLLLVILAFNYVDRMALGLLMQDIKLDLDLTDTQLGVLTGIAFALFYSLMGIPMARWADRGNRVTVITVTTALWSAAVALCGVAGNFAQLLLIRIGVAVGEAGCVPPAHSLIADTFTRAERPRAVARYMLGMPLSFVIGYLPAGWLNEQYGWRLTFVLLGLPGLVLAVLARFTLREPRERQSVSNTTRTDATATATASAPTPAPAPKLREVLVTLWANLTFRHLLLSLAISQFFGAGILQWKPAFFMRSYGLDTAELGAWFAAIYGIGGVLGTYLGGELAARYAAKNERLQLGTIAMAYCGFGVISAGIYMSPTPHMALALMALATVGFYATIGPLFATIQSLVRERMRAMSIALIYLFANLIGLGFGPLAAGALSDAFLPYAGNESLRYALLALCPGYLWAAWHLFRAGTTVMGDLNRVQETSLRPCDASN